MNDAILVHEQFLRLGFFGGTLAAMAAWEFAAPRRRQSLNRIQRWPRNLALVLLNTLAVRLLLPASAVGVAVFGQQRGWGLLSAAGIHGVWAIPVSILLLDLAIYLQHVLFHAVPALWRLHRVHHADLDFDVTTGLRFHPIEIVLSLAIKLGAVAALGAPPAAVLIFEVLLNATSMFNHGNVRIPLRLDSALRWLVVTPDMHRVHHSIVPTETNSNFGFNLPWWDRLLGTYRPQPGAGHGAMTIGLEHFRTAGDLRLGRMLLQPFRAAAGPDPIHRGGNQP